MASPKDKKQTSFQAPKGTRDSYPDDLLRRRYITESWRAVSIRHGFEEIDGPTFEHSDLYAVKSGEGILGELFQAYSGKSPEEVEQVMQEGRAPYALRPEFTPTLARMYAARAKQLPGVTRWFCVQPFFRAERPQRGRLREFYQWNSDVVGGEAENQASFVWHDLESTNTCLALFKELGMSAQTVQLKYGDRRVLNDIANKCRIPTQHIETIFRIMDMLDKVTKEEALQAIGSSDITPESVDEFFKYSKGVQEAGTLNARFDATGVQDNTHEIMVTLGRLLIDTGWQDWFTPDISIVRGLAYYTGTVFEVIAEGERAVAGGGRYDNLIELFGGPPTPAVGFGMGDVVLTNLLDDRNLMPEGPQLRDAIDRTVRTTSLRPEMFVVPDGDPAHEGLVTPLLANLRRGVEREGFQDELASGEAKPWSAGRYTCRPIHARTTDKATRNPKKLLADANKQHARFFVEIHGSDKVEVRDLDAGEALTPKTAFNNNDHASFSIDPASPAYVGKLFAS